MQEEPGAAHIKRRSRNTRERLRYEHIPCAPLHQGHSCKCYMLTSLAAYTSVLTAMRSPTRGQTALRVPGFESCVVLRCDTSLAYTSDEQTHRHPIPLISPHPTLPHPTPPIPLQPILAHPTPPIPTHNALPNLTTTNPFDLTPPHTNPPIPPYLIPPHPPHSTTPYLTPPHPSQPKPLGSSAIPAAQ